MKSLDFLLKLLEGETTPEPTSEIENVLAMKKLNQSKEVAVQRLNQSKQVPNFESQSNQMLNNGKANASSNGSGNSTAFNGIFDIRQDVALVSGIKVELEKAGLLTTAENHNQVLQLEKLAQILQIAFKDKLAAAAEASCKNERQRLLAILAQMRQAPDIDTLFRTTVTEVRKHLQVDRALIYRFQDEDSGVVLAESMEGGYTPSLGKILAARIFEAEAGPVYQQQQMVAWANIYQVSLSPYQLQLLEQFQVKASLNLPIVLEGQVWGLLVVQQCSSPRPWQETEISLLYQIVTELTLNLQPDEFRLQLQCLAEQEKVLAKVIEKIQRKDSGGRLRK